MTRVPVRVARLATAAALLSMTASLATAAATTHRRPARHTRAAAPARAGMVIGLDPETGHIAMPSPGQMARLGGATTATHPAPVRHADGSMSLNTRDWMRSFSVVRLGPDGRRIVTCVEGAEAAKRARTAPPAPAAEDR